MPGSADDVARCCRSVADRRPERRADRVREPGRLGRLGDDARDPQRPGLGRADDGLAATERGRDDDPGRLLPAVANCAGEVEPALPRRATRRRWRQNAPPGSDVRAATPRRPCSHRDDLGPPAAELLPDDPARVVVVVDDEDPAALEGTLGRLRDGTSAGAGPTSARSRNVEPSPGTPVLSIVMSPPISSASRRLIARPRPVPPKRRLVETSAWLNDWNRRPTRSGGMPRPVSLTAAEIAIGPSRVADRVGLDGQRDLPRVGELDRVAQQVQQDLAEPRDVADDDARRARPDVADQLEALLGRPGGHQLQRRLDALVEVERGGLQVHPPRLDLREVEDVVDDREQGLAAGADDLRVVALVAGQLGVEQQPAHPDHGVHRRPDLVAHAGEEDRLRLRRRLGRLAGGLQLRDVVVDHVVAGPLAVDGQRHHDDLDVDQRAVLAHAARDPRRAAGRLGLAGQRPALVVRRVRRRARGRRSPGPSPRPR